MTVVSVWLRMISRGFVTVVPPRVVVDSVTAAGGIAPGIVIVP